MSFEHKKKQHEKGEYHRLNALSDSFLETENSMLIDDLYTETAIIYIANVVNMDVMDFLVSACGECDYYIIVNNTNRITCENRRVHIYNRTSKDKSDLSTFAYGMTKLKKEYTNVKFMKDNSVLCGEINL